MVLSLVGQARVLAVLLVLLADKIIGGNMKIWQQMKKLCSVVVEMATISQLMVARSLVGKRINIAVADKMIGDNMKVQQQKWRLYVIVVVVVAVTRLIMV